VWKYALFRGPTRSKLVTDADDIAQLLDVWESRGPEKSHVLVDNKRHSCSLVVYCC
jgi:hypothetical protein